MRPFILVGALVGALVATRGAAQGQSPQQRGETSDGHPQEQERGKEIKGYGYGEQPGKADSAAKQESGEARRKSTAPQDERRSSAEARGGEGSATGERARTITGRIVKAGSRSVSLKGDDRRVHRLRLDDKTRILRDGEEVPIQTLQPGEEVRAAFDTRRGRRVATTITLVESGAREPPSHTDTGRESERRLDGEPARQDAPPGQDTERRQDEQPRHQDR